MTVENRAIAILFFRFDAFLLSAFDRLALFRSFRAVTSRRTGTDYR